MIARLLARLLDFLNPLPYCGCGGDLHLVEVWGRSDLIVCSVCTSPARARR